MCYVCTVVLQVQSWTWTLGYAWRTTNWLLHIDAIALLLTSVCVLLILCRGCWTYYAAILNSRNDARRRWSELSSRLHWGLAHVKSIGAIAPALGLAGTCFGVLYGFRAVVGDRETATRYIASQMAAALVPTALGLAIGVGAQFVEWFLRGRIDAAKLRALKRFESTALSNTSYFGDQITGRFPLQARFSQLPAFPILAAPSLILLAAWFIPFYVSLGFHVRLTRPTVSTSADSLAASSINIAVVLGRSGSRNVYLDGKQVQAETLRELLLRERTNSSQMTLVQADGNVRWADVAGVIDAAKFTSKDVVLLTTAPDISSGRAHHTLKPKR